MITGFEANTYNEGSRSVVSCKEYSLIITGCTAETPKTEVDCLFYTEKNTKELSW